jgi:hypothetical protein
MMSPGQVQLRGSLTNTSVTGHARPHGRDLAEQRQRASCTAWLAAEPRSSSGWRFLRRVRYPWSACGPGCSVDSSSRPT